MKKRFKLLSTIASLCLALAMVVFGVYAATSVQVRTEGTYIDFICDHVLVDIKVEYFQGPSSGLFTDTYKTNTFTGATYTGTIDLDEEEEDIEGFTAATFSPALTAQSVTYTSSAPSAGIRITLMMPTTSLDTQYFTIKSLPPTTGGSDKLVDSSNSTVSLKVDGEDYTTANTAIALDPPEYHSGGKGESSYWETFPVVITYQRTLTKFATTFSSETCWESVIKLGYNAAAATA